MKKIAAVIAGAVLSVSMSACVGVPTPTKTVTESSSGFSNTPSTSDRDEAYADLVRDNTSLTGETSEFVSTGKAICTAFDNGNSFDDVINTITDDGVGEYDAGFLVGASVGTYCDEHANLFQEDTY